MSKPKLRDGKPNKRYELYPINKTTNKIIYEIAKWIVYHFAVGKHDINGDDWGDIFSKAILGDHLARPVGLADVVLDGMAWSMKSVKNNDPFNCNRVRVISGRCSPDYSYGITDPHSDIQATGRAVLGIWNERVNIALDQFNPLRSCILIRNPNTLEFALHEHELHRFNTNEFRWKKNRNGNLQGYTISDNKHKFTWQPHGSQFTIIYDIEKDSSLFRIQRPPVLDFNQTLTQIGFTNDWVTFIEKVESSV